MGEEATRLERGSERVGKLSTLIMVEVAAVVSLHRLGRLPGLAVDWRDLPAWMTASSAEDVLAATLRLVALAGAYWLLVSTALFFVARLADIPAAVRAVEWATLPAVRALADRAVAVALVSSTATGGAGMAAGVAPPLEVPLVVLGEQESALPPEIPPPPTVEVPNLHVPVPTTPDGPLVPADPQAPPAPMVRGDGERSMTEGASRTPAESAISRSGEFHEVVRGDNLWSIAASTLRRRHGREEITAREIAPYWRLVVDANRHRLRSGNPNLIFQGERVRLPG